MSESCSVARSLNLGRPVTERFIIPVAEKDTLILPDVLSDHMLFCCDRPIPVWGAGAPGTHVTVVLSQQFNRQIVQHTEFIIGDDGSFIIHLDPMPASETSYHLSLTTPKKSYEIKDVLFGILLLASGQSNMQVNVGECLDASDLIRSARNSALRFYAPPIVPIMTAEMASWFGITADDPDKLYPPHPVLNPDATAGAWIRDDSQQIEPVSAIGYSAALELHRLTHLPVGVMSLPVGGTSIVPWLPRICGDENEQLRTLIGERYLADDEAYANANTYNFYSALYMTKIAPVSPLPISAMLWYQGESDEGALNMYPVALEELVNRWSTVFGFDDGKMPTVFCHLAPFHSGSTDPVPVWAKVRFNRIFSLNAAAHSDTRACVVNYDVDLTYACGGDKEPIHPRVKTPIGQRCGDALYKLLFDRECNWALSPKTTEIIPDGSGLLVKFDSIGDGLRTLDALPVRGFTIAEENGTFYRADARIIAPDTVRLSSRFVHRPAHASYAYCFYNMKSNLCNSCGIPVEPFITCDATEKLYSQHDYETCDFTHVWRYFNDEVKENRGRMVPLFEGENISLISSDSVKGKALRIRGKNPTLSVILDYPGDTHSFNDYSLLSFCVKGLPAAVAVVDSEKKEYPLSVASCTPCSNGFTCYTYRLDKHTYPLQLARLRISFKGDAIIDEFELGN